MCFGLSKSESQVVCMPCYVISIEMQRSTRQKGAVARSPASNMVLCRIMLCGSRNSRRVGHCLIGLMFVFWTWSVEAWVQVSL